MLPRKVFYGGKKGLCSKLKQPNPNNQSLSRRWKSQELYYEYIPSTGKRFSISTETLAEVPVPEPAQATRPINLDELFPDREQMNIPEVGILRKAANPIIIITKETNSESEEDEELSEKVASAPVEAVPEAKAQPQASEVRPKAKEAQEKSDKPKVETEQKVTKESSKSNIDLLEKLVSLHGGWFDNDIRKKIKPIPKGWQLIPV